MENRATFKQEIVESKMGVTDAPAVVSINKELNEENAIWIRKEEVDQNSSIAQTYAPTAHWLHREKSGVLLAFPLSTHGFILNEHNSF